VGTGAGTNKSRQSLLELGPTSQKSIGKNAAVYHVDNIFSAYHLSCAPSPRSQGFRPSIDLGLMPPSSAPAPMHVGVRIFYLDDKMILQTHLLAVKLFRPDPSLGKITGRVVMKWATQVLAQHGIDKEDIAGAVTDAGADVSTGVGQEFAREWCFPHATNRALVFGTGQSTSRSGALINPECKTLLGKCKPVIEYFNRSTQSKVRQMSICVQTTFLGGRLLQSTVAAVETEPHHCSRSI